MAEERNVILLSSDNEQFHVEFEEALQMKYVKNVIKLQGDDKKFIKDSDSDRVLTVTNVSSSIFKKVIEYIRYHLEANKSNKPKEEVKNWDTQFVNVNEQILVNLLMAADFLDVSNLLDLLCQTVADKIKDLSPEQIRERFNIKNDFTPEEEDQIRREIQWAFD
ncbi:hypothetical protein SUGI_0360800 [Cryptomeria japonica]|uniref:SKP1-like protein 1B n=1 Tax=Cryptomeria japonica TaxID=3369 RepID=UPI002408DF73|nr:SKP1-like protein 1B [Cryptomeria japonica]GLJ19913.1 hypothetical protein SUGI_0360800 [Cryptomeria japonica]